MKNKSLSRLLPAICLAIGLAGMAQAQTLQSIDFTPLEGTAWGDSTVRLDFGAAGMGTVTFTGINGGAYHNSQAPGPYNVAPYSSYQGPTTLSDGSIFSPSQEAFFTTLPSTNAGLSGFNMTVTLDSGVFADGSVFSARSFGANANGTDFQYLQPVSGLAAPDSVQLPSDGGNQQDMVLLDALNNLYGAAATTSASRGLAFDIQGGSFSVNFLTTTNYQPGGQAMTIVTPIAAVPEPSAALLACLGGVLIRTRRRRR